MAEAPRGSAPRDGAVVISTDVDFRETLAAALDGYEGDLRVEMELPVSYPDIGDAELDRLRELRPAVVFLDLESEPQVGLRFAQFLMDEDLADALVGAGTETSPEVLLSAMQAGILEFLPKPVTPDSVVAAVRRLERKTGRRAAVEEEQEPGRLVSIFSAKGGTGGTYVATNLAVEIHRLTRQRTLLVDLDLELGETALLLDMNPKFSVVDLLRNFHRVDAGLLASYIERHDSGVELLSAPYEPVDFEAVSGERVGQVLEFLKQRYDYIVADVPKTFNPVTLTAFRHTDDLLLLTTADLQALRNCTRALPLLKKVGAERRDEWLRVVVNRYESGQVITLGEVRKTLDMDVSATVRNDYRAVMEAINEGKPAVLDQESKHAADIRSLAEELTGISATEKEAPGFFSRIMQAIRGDSTGPGIGQEEVKASG